MNVFTDLTPNWQWAIAVWLAVVGGCVGSFLNVVVYRLPAGKSLIRPGSFCPKCGHPIRWYDNVPVFGWFLLRGRCRDCHEPISFRYPLVEAITAAMFFGLAWVELLSGGANLPALVLVENVKENNLSPAWNSGDVAAIYAFHLLLLCTLLAAALIQYDGHRIPRRLFIPSLLVGVAAPLLWVQPETAALVCWSTTVVDLLLIDLLLEVAAGLAVGWILGWFLPSRAKDKGATGVSPVPAENRQGQDAPRIPRRVRDCANDGVVLAAVCAGLYLGLGAVLVLGTLVLILTLLGLLIRRIWRGFPAIGPVIWLVAIVPFWIAFWRPLATFWDCRLP